MSQRILASAAEALAGGRVAVSFSGGKDSLVALHLARQVFGSGVAVLFADSGAEYPETLQFISELEAAWGLDLYLVPPDKTILEMHEASGWWDWQPREHTRRYDLVRVLIQEPMERARLHLGLRGQVIGLRAGESNGRELLFRVRGAVHGIQKPDGSPFLHIHPLASWSTADVWAYIAGNGLPYCAVYDRLAALGVPREHWRVSSWAGTTGVWAGRFTTLRAGWPDLYQRFADAFPRIKEAT